LIFWAFYRIYKNGETKSSLSTHSAFFIDIISIQNGNNASQTCNKLCSLFEKDAAASDKFRKKMVETVSIGKFVC